MKDDSLFGVAGLWDSWIAPTGEKVHTCTILTTAPNELMAGIHDRMPAILSKEHQKEWLNPRNQYRNQLKSLLVPFVASKMMAYEVENKVNSPKNNSVELIQRVV